MKINNKLLCLFEGRCWHDEEEVYGYYDPTFISHKCKKCGKSHPEYPDYAENTADRERLLQYLMGQGEMWNYFSCFVIYQHDPNGFDHEEISKHLIPWFFLPLPDTTIPRWLFLLQEWLQLEETREKFGVVECTAWMDGSCREADCNYHKQGLTVHPDGYGCYVIAEWAKGE